MCKLENRYKHILTGEVFKVINFTTTLDSVTDIVTVKSLKNNIEAEMCESVFRKDFIKIKNNMKNSKTLELLNFEGPVLKLLKKSEGEFIFLDQWNKELKTATLEEVLNFLDGDITITDSRNKTWHWPSEADSAKSSLKNIFKFLH